VSHRLRGALRNAAAGLQQHEETRQECNLLHLPSVRMGVPAGVDSLHPACLRDRLRGHRQNMLRRNAKPISNAITRAHSTRLLELNTSVAGVTRVLQPAIPPRLSSNPVGHRSSECVAMRGRCICRATAIRARRYAAHNAR
jgi:hypothetical protein